MLIKYNCIYLLQTEFEGGKNTPDSHVHFDAKKIAEQIYYFNSKYFDNKIEVALNDPDPNGYECEVSPKHQKQIVYQDEVVCFNKTMKSCSKVT